jgi:nucleoside-diphosphate-sugar epimerase
MKIGIIGCGWLGLPLGKILAQNGHQVLGTTTSLDKMTILQQANISPMLLRFSPQPSASLQAFFDVDVLVIALPPRVAHHGAEHHLQQIESIFEHLAGHQISQIIYISSTSVYPEHNQIATENTEIIEDSVLIKAENLLRAKHPQALILRCGGLMGYDRIPYKYFVGKTIKTADIPVNFIHQDDVVAIIKLLIEQNIGGQTFNLVAPLHPIRKDVYQANSVRFAWPAPIFEAPNQSIPFKIVSPELLITQLNYQFIYPNPVYFF